MKINITFQKDDPNLHEKLNNLIRQIERGVILAIEREVNKKIKDVSKVEIHINEGEST